MKWSHVIGASLTALTLLFWGPLLKSSGQSLSTDKFKLPVPELIVAVRHGDHARIRELLAQGVDPNVRDTEASRPLPAWAWSFLVGDEKGLAHFSDTDLVIDKNGARAALSYVAVRGNAELAKNVIDNAETADGAALTLAAGSGDLAMVRLLLDHGANPNLVVSHADTALMAAARTGNGDIIRALVAKNADVEARDHAGRTALLWAVRSGSLDAVTAILNAGANVNVANYAGTTPLALAARRGNTEIVELLRKQGAHGDPKPGAGAANSPEVAVKKSLHLLQIGADSWLDRKSCISCHHQGMMVSTTALARKRGFPIDERLARRQIEAITSRDHRYSDLQYAVKSVDARLRADFDGGLAMRAAFFLSALLDTGWKPNDYTAVAARVVAESQWVDGRWNHGQPRPPISSSDLAATAFAARVLPAYAPKAQEQTIAYQIERARRWLVATRPMTTDDKSFRLFGLHWVGADKHEVSEAAAQLLDDQRPDGGWAQLPGLASDAYATGQVLVALHQAGGVATSDEAYQSGIRYLLRTQEEDGSWIVSSRSVPNNVFFESGYPHGKFQFISFAGSCWATQALLLAASP